uniref:Uncharacterized protein n=1 Tax=Meloidogyne incognita TaxID=6306 RepID=A0A914LQD5_MELIC
MLRGPMPQTKEAEGRPQFWSFNQQHPPLITTTTEKPKSSEDYYDAIKDEDGSEQKGKNQEDDLSGALHLMTALQTNVNPLFPILPSGISNKNTKPDIKLLKQENQEKQRSLVEGDTYDDDQVEIDQTGSNKNFQTKKNSELNEGPMIVLLPDIEMEQSTVNKQKKDGLILVDEATAAENKNVRPNLATPPKAEITVFN